jgi:membrane associated rhomboid family serine protease
LIGVYVLEVAAAGAQALVRGPSALQLINLGASIGIAELPREGLVGIAVGQEWRLFTSMFLHAGIFHLLMNCYALFLFGNIVEQEFGRIRFVTLYLVSGLAAGAFSYAFGVPFVAGVGASGAIFGVFGAFLGVSYRRRHMAFYAARLRSALMLIAINVVIGLTVPSIDWRAHLGGLVVGFAGGFAAEGFGRGKVKAVQFGVVMAVMLGAAVVLTVWRTQQIREMFGL